MLMRKMEEAILIYTSVRLEVSLNYSELSGKRVITRGNYRELTASLKTLETTMGKERGNIEHGRRLNKEDNGKRSRRSM